MHDFLKWRFLGRGECKVFLQKWILYSWTQNSLIWTRQLSSNYLHLHQVDIWNGVWDMIKFVSKSCPRENPEKQAKKGNFLISASEYQKYTKLTSRCISLRIIKDVKTQDGHQLWLKNRFRYKASSKIPKLWNLTQTPTHLGCNIHLIANFLSFHMSLVVVMHFGARNALHGIEISMHRCY